MAREEFEIDLVDLIKFCWKKVWYFVIPMAVAAVLLVAFCVISIKMDPEKSPLPNKYTSTAKILVRETSAKSSISSSLSSLASMAGVNLGSASGGTSNGVLITTLAETNTFRDDIIEKFDLISKYKIKKNVKTSSRKALSKALSVKLDDKTGVLSVSFTDIDPEFAHEVTAYATDLLIEMFYQVSEDDDIINLKNYQEAMDESFLKIVQYQKDIQELEQSVSNAYATSVPSIMFDVTMKKMELEAEETIYATFRGQHELLSIQMKDNPTTLKLIEAAETPDLKSGPSRGMICIVAELIVFVLCFVIVFIKYYKFAVSQQQAALVADTKEEKK